MAISVYVNGRQTPSEPSPSFGQTRSTRAGGNPDSSTWKPKRVQLEPEPARPMSCWKRFKMRVSDMDSTQWAVTIFCAFLIVWAVVVSVLLLLIPLRYLNDVVASERLRFLVSGAARWARAEAARELVGVAQARDGLRAALRSEAVGGSWDVSTLEQILAPVFSTVPFLHQMEIIFPDRFPSSTVVGAGVVSGTGALQVVVQSNAEDCFLFGTDACLEGPAPPSRAPPWYQVAQQLDSKIEIAAAEAAAFSELKRSTGRTEAGSAIATYQPDPLELDNFELGGDAAAWEMAPSMSLVQGTGDEWDVQTWLPTYGFLFRLGTSDSNSASGLDPESTGQEQERALAGRIVVKLGALSAGRLQVEQLGRSGSVYLVDRSGVVLAASDPLRLVVVSGGSRRLGFKHVSEMPGASASAAVLSEALAKGKDADFRQGDGHVALAFLPGLLSHFAVVACSESLDSFSDGSMASTSLTCMVFAGLPYFSAVVSLLLAVVARLTLRRVDKDGSGDEGPVGSASMYMHDPNRSSISRMRGSAIGHMDTLRSQLAQMSIQQRLKALEAEALGKNASQGMESAISDASGELALANNPPRGLGGAN